MKEWLGIHTTSNTLDQLLGWIKRRYKGSKIRKQIIRASIFATVYSIWQERNCAYWNMHIHTVEKIVNDIKHNVKKRIESRLPQRMKEVDRN